MRNFITELYDYCPHISTQYSNAPRRSCSSCCLCHISMWLLLSYYGSRVPGAVALLNQTNITTDIETSASRPTWIEHYFAPLQIFFFPLCVFLFCIYTLRRYATEQIAPTLSMSLLSPAECGASLSQNWVELHLQSAAK